MFSRTTIIALVNVLKLDTRAKIEEFALEFGLEHEITGSYMKEKNVSIMRHLIQNPDATTPKGAPLIQAIMEYLISNIPEYSNPTEQFRVLVNSLDHDGYVLDQKRLRRKLPDQIPIAAQEDELIEILTRFNFNVAKGHYAQAIAAHARGDWAAANAQLRSFVEELFDRIAESIIPGSYSSSTERRMALSKAGFFKIELNEWTNDGKGFLQGFWKRLHPEGPHPGLSEKDDCTFRLHLVIITMHHIAKRFAVQFE